MNSATSLVRRVTDCDCARLPGQTPDKNGVWDGIRFTIVEVRDCDHVAILDKCVHESVQVWFPSTYVWPLIQERAPSH
jgi:hypothetical protein